jgi:hypothetical protein
MKRHILALLCPLLLAACSAEVAVDTPPQSVSIPITSAVRPVYVEVAVDMPEETQDLDVVVKQITADLAVVNPSKAFTLRSSARLSLTGNATPDNPILYTDNNPPPYYATAEELLPQQPFPPSTRTPVNVNSPTLAKAIGKARIWVIVANTVSSTGIGDPLPLELRLEDIVLHAVIAKPFEGLDGALGPGGL